MDSYGRYACESVLGDLSMVYLDYAASAPMDTFLAYDIPDRVIRYYGNPSSMHQQGVKANKLINDSKRMIAEIINCEPEEIYFTSGGTESDNWALRGIVKPGDHIITTAIEHSAVLETCKYLETKGVEVTYVKPDKDGRVALKDVIAAKRDNTKLLSIMYVNNETGVVQHIKSIAEWAKSEGIIVHTDAVQAVGKLLINLKELDVDLLSASAHKFGGLKGTGFLYVRKGTEIAPLIFGGGQQNGMRSGTEDAVGAYFMAVSLVAFHNKTLALALTTEKTLRHLVNSLFGISGVYANSYIHTNIVNVYIEGVDAESLVTAMSEMGYYISAGSACHSGDKKPSHVLKAMGYSDERCNQSIRISIGYETTVPEIDEFIEMLKVNINLLRQGKANEENEHV